ncbi:MAG: DJ-1/PfpI family protein [Acidobacteriaceae bacterium]
MRRKCSRLQLLRFTSNLRIRLIGMESCGGSHVAAICAATLALAHTGLLDEREHTSNGRRFIEKYVHKYQGQGMYRASRAVSDRLVITANGVALVAFAAEILRTLAPERKLDIETYERLHAHGLLD